MDDIFDCKCGKRIFGNENTFRFHKEMCGQYVDDNKAIPFPEETLLIQASDGLHAIPLLYIRNIIERKQKLRIDKHNRTLILAIIEEWYKHIKGE